MPSKNEFIPHNLSVKKIKVTHPHDSPTLIYCDEDIRIQYKKNDQFWVPQASVYVILRILLGQMPANYIKAKLYCDLIIDRLSEDSYNTKQAGFIYNISPNQLGLVFSIEGYNKKMLVLLRKVISQMYNLTINPTRFITIKKHLM